MSLHPRLPGQRRCAASAAIFSLTDAASLARYLPGLHIVPVDRPWDGTVEHHWLERVTLSFLEFQGCSLRSEPVKPSDDVVRVLVRLGNATINVRQDNTQAQLEAFDWQVLRVGSPVNIGVADALAMGKVLLIDFDARLWRNGERELIAGIPNRYGDPLNAVFAGAATRVFEAARATLMSAPDAALGLLSFIRLSRPFQAGHRDRSSDPLIARSERTIALRYADAAFNIPQLARVLGVSRRLLDKAYSATNASSPAEALWETRLCAASDALRSPASDGLSISEIARSHGFSNESHFSRRFKKRFGISPRKLRQHESIYRYGRPAMKMPEPN